MAGYGRLWIQLLWPRKPGRTGQSIYKLRFVSAILSSNPMSLLEIGVQCEACNLIDFLPTTCPLCHHVFCGSHIHTHPCSEAPTFSRFPNAGPSSFKPKATCEQRGCGNPTMEAISGKESATKTGLVKQIRCSGCDLAFCTMYVALRQRGCTGG